MRSFTILFFFVSASGYVNDYWNHYSDIEKRVLENYGVHNLGWGRSRRVNWLNYDDGVKYDVAKGVSLGYDQKYSTELKVVNEKVTDESNFIRPCNFYDIECIRKVFARNSQCTPAYGLPDPLYLARSTLYFPYANLTLTLTDAKVTGLGSAEVAEFYVNKKTGNLVFAITVRHFNETTEKTYFTYRRTAKEFIVLADFTTIVFDSLTFTAIIPKTHEGLRLDLGEFHADIQDAAPKFVYGPKAYDSKDPEVIKSYTELTTNLPVIVREAFLFQAQLLTAVYIQSNICDFGVKLYTY